MSPLLHTHSNKALLKRLHFPCVNPVGEVRLINTEVVRSRMQQRQIQLSYIHISFTTDRGRCTERMRGTSPGLLSQPVSPKTSYFLQLTPISRNNPMPHALFMRGWSRVCSLAVCVSHPHPHAPKPQSLPLQTVICPCAQLMCTLPSFLILWWIQFIGCNVFKTERSHRIGQERQMLSHIIYSNLSKNTD